ncbi:MAG: exodeoxyribonuclease V subunit gamma [Kiritimatiellae bacterium]|nr:exodeoxyribonuclease V subunit gamma [Kiritimatiellia bacterium]
MRPLVVNWSNKLENMADNMFSSLYGENAIWNNPMTPRCIVTNSPVMQAWLRHYFIFDWSKRNGSPVLANCDFQLLYPFINDWMDTLLIDHTGAEHADRSPRNHPYSTINLKWRIYRLLVDDKLDDIIFETIKKYLGNAPTPRRQFQLAGKLATIFDDYQVYRYDIVTTWKNKSNDWQARLWALLIEENKNSYANLFRKIDNVDTDLAKAFDNKYEQVAVFGTTTMPLPYISFLNEVLPKVVDVDIYVLNPGKEYWLEDVSERKNKSIQEKLKLADLIIPDDPLTAPEKGHDLLCSLGESLQEHLYVLNEQCYEGDCDLFEANKNRSLLDKLQNEILENYTKESSNEEREYPQDDDSIQVHICHSARREVEILHDYLLDWLTNEKSNGEKLQPHQIQVLVSDMETYAPHIDAIFSSTVKNSIKSVPYAIDARTSSADSEILNAFMSICNIVTSRFQVTSIIDLLATESILESFNLTQSNLTTIESIVSAANIRWGLDAKHREDIANVTMPAYMTWEYGLDRLLAGYATGESDWHDDLLTVDHVEGSSAEVLGKLAKFIHKLKYYNNETDNNRTLADWYEFLAELLDTFFVSTENTYREISRIRSAINDLIPLGTNSGMDEKEIPFEVIVAHLSQALARNTSGDSLTPNSVIFCQLRPMNSHPSEITCLLGLNDSTFPRKDNRPTFDLLEQTRRKGDRSLRRDDRCAFLESIVNARKRLYLSYTGRSDKDNEAIPPSIVLQELKDYLSNNYKMKKITLFDGSNGLPFETLHHLNAIHPDYFNDTDNKLFSYSNQTFMATKQLINSKKHQDDINFSEPLIEPTLPTVIELQELKDFFINPAKQFYKKNLEIQLGSKRSILPDNDEPMTVDALSSYNLKSTILSKLQESGFTKFKNRELTKSEKVNGNIPLSKTGDDAIQKITADITIWTENFFSINDTECNSIRAAISTQEGTEETPSELTISMDNIGAINIHGSQRIFKLECLNNKDNQVNSTGKNTNRAGTETFNIQLEVRPSSLKTKDKIRAWVSHLFTCSVTDNIDYTITIGMNSKNRCESIAFRSLEKELATKELKKLLELYIQGQTRPLPFAPETSAAYYEHLNPNKETDKTPEHTTAIYSAVNRWGSRKSNTVPRPECLDDSLFHAFGEDGPAYIHGNENPTFAEVAINFFTPMLKKDKLEEEEK